MVSLRAGRKRYRPNRVGRAPPGDSAPILDASNPQQINGYSYSGNSPITSADPTGLIQDIDRNAGGSYQSTTNVGGIPVTSTYDPHTGKTTVSVAGIPVTHYRDSGKGGAHSMVLDDSVVWDPYGWAKKSPNSTPRPKRAAIPSSPSSWP
jgi:hypothetical protein